VKAMTKSDGDGRSAWENFDAKAMEVMRVDARAHHPARILVDDLIRREFGRRHFRWLDVGVVGMVDYERLVGTLNFTFTGADIGRSIIEDSRKYLRQSGDRVLLWNTEDPIEEAEGPLAPGGFDLITARHVLNHCNYYEQPLLHMHHVLDDQGLCIITLHLNLIEGPDQLRRHNDWAVPGEVIGNRYNNNKFLRYLAQYFHMERFVRWDDGYKPNDVLVARKRQPGADLGPLPKMEIQRPPLRLRSRLAKALHLR